MNLSGMIYFSRRVGWRWQVWCAHQDGGPDPANGATQWQASSVLFWRKLNADRVAIDMWSTFNSGVFVANNRAMTSPSALSANGER